MTKNRRHKINSNMTLSKWMFFAATCGVVFALYFMFCVVPILQSVKMSFYKWGGYKTKTYIQWKNYADVLKDRVFWKALKNDLIITLIKEILICSLTVLFAVTLTRFRMKTPEVVLYKFVFYIPNVISTIIIGSLWGFVFMPSGMGLMNSICSIFKSGVDVDWVTKYPLGVIGFVASWCGVGLFMLTMIASIHQIPGELYEAAKIDGASKVRCIFSITLPLIKNIVVLMFIMSIGNVFKGDFGMIYPFIGDNALLYPTTDVIDTYVFRALRSFTNYGRTAAIGLYQSIMGFGLVLFANWLAKRYAPESAIF